VGAYLLSAAQPGAEVIAEAADDHDPLLAVRQVGLGRSVGLAVSPVAADNPEWGGGKLADLVAAGVRWSIRPSADSRFSGSARRRGGRIHVTVDARDAAGPVNGLQLRARLQRMDAVAANLPGRFPLDQAAPGRYAGDVADLGGPVAVEVSAGASVVWQAVLPARAPAEFRAVGADHTSLRRLAELTGGRVMSLAQVAAMGQGLVEARRTALWPALLAAAAALMLLEWAVARVRRRG